MEECNACGGEPRIGFDKFALETLDGNTIEKGTPNTERTVQHDVHVESDIKMAFDVARPYVIAEVLEAGIWVHSVLIAGMLADYENFKKRLNDTDRRCEDFASSLSCSKATWLAEAKKPGLWCSGSSNACALFPIPLRPKSASTLPTAFLRHSVVTVRGPSSTSGPGQA